MPRQIDLRAGNRPGAGVDQDGVEVAAFAPLALAVGDKWIDERGQSHTVKARYRGEDGEEVVVSHGPIPLDYNDL